MLLPAGKEASWGDGTPHYERHRPERTLLYQLVKEHYPAFEAHCGAEGKTLPDYVRQEFEDYLKCGRLEHGFLRVQCDTCHAEHLDRADKDSTNNSLAAVLPGLVAGASH
jgi:hypothetical protein